MRRLLISTLFVAAFLGTFLLPEAVLAQTRISTPSATSSPTLSPTPAPTPAPDLTEKTESTIGPLEKILKSQKLGSTWPLNPIKYAIKFAVGAGVPPNTIVLLLLLPVVASIIAAARHLIGLRGFGIFLPAALSVVFVATGPILGIGLFLLIVTTSTLVRIVLRKLKVRLQYLPRMALILWFVALAVLGLLFLAPVIKNSEVANVSIFAVLIMALLAEDFTRVQLGKSVKTALSLTAETLILSLVSYIFLTVKFFQEFALLNPEILLIGVFVFDFVLGKYIGLRLLEFYRFRKSITT